MMLRLLFTLLLISSTFYAELVKVPDSFQIKFHQVKFSGNTVFPNVELEGLLKNYIDKPIAIDKIHEAKELVTKYYISHGYVNSGAVLPDQDITSGILEIKIIEGKLEKLKLTQNTRFSEQYLWGRVEEYADQPLHFPSLQLPLYFLHADRTVSRVNAELQPTEIFGESELKLALEERELITFSVGLNNHKSPSVGDLTRTADVGIYNVTGWNDTTQIGYSNSNGLRDYNVLFSIPINYKDTRLIMGYQDSSSTIINDIFESLDIDSSSQVFDVGIRHPFYRNYNSEFAMSLKLTLKRNETTLLGFPYQYTAELDDGVSRRTIISFGQEWINRSHKHALTIRSTFDLSTNWMGATTVNHPADGEYIAWLGQFQWLYRLPFWNSQVLLKSNLRLANDELPPSEKFGIGGYSTVRGYRENSFTGDMGFTSSIEYHMLLGNFKIPGISDGPEDGDIYIIPFFDYGSIWNKEFDQLDENIASVGLGLRWSLNKDSLLEVFWGHGLVDIPDYEDYSLQDDGIHFCFNLAF